MLNTVSDIIYHFVKYTNISKDIILPVFSGFIEITNGLQLICNLENISLTLKLILISMITGWGGLSVHFQILSVTRSSDLSIRPYLFGKFCKVLLLHYTRI